MELGRNGILASKLPRRNLTWATSASGVDAGACAKLDKSAGANPHPARCLLSNGIPAVPIQPEFPLGGSPDAQLERLLKLKILIVTDHASAQFGGEAARPLHYFRVMRKMNIDVVMLTHDRVRAKLAVTLSDDIDRVIFIADNWAHKWLWSISKPLPARISYFTTGFLSRTITQVLQRRIARRLVQEHGIDFVLQPMSVSPREPSLMYDVGAPVIIGPLNGNMLYPPAFRKAAAWASAFENVGRGLGWPRAAPRSSGRARPCGRLPATAALG